MTIKQLVHKLKVATNENWGYELVDGKISEILAMPITETYDMTIDGRSNGHMITKNYIEPLPPESFAAKELVDGIIGSKEFMNQLVAKLKKELDK